MLVTGRPQIYDHNGELLIESEHLDPGGHNSEQQKRFLNSDLNDLPFQKNVFLRQELLSMKHLNEWDFEIFDFFVQAPNTILSQVSQPSSLLIILWFEKAFNGLSSSYSFAPASNRTGYNHSWRVRLRAYFVSK